MLGNSHIRLNPSRDNLDKSHNYIPFGLTLDFLSSKLGTLGRTLFYDEKIPKRGLKSVGRTYPRCDRNTGEVINFSRLITPPERPALLNCLRSVIAGQHT